jgi:hypothetical protein
MKDREIIAQLKKLKAVYPSQQWLEEQGALLRSQVYSGVEAREELGFWEKFELLTARMSQPYAMAAMIMLFFVGSAGASVWMGQNAKPGEPLYIAKQLSEKTQFALAFNDKSKAKLSVEFAKARVQEMVAMVNDTGNTSQTANLASNFHKEIQAAKDRVAKVMPGTPATAKTEVAKAKDAKPAVVAKNVAKAKPAKGKATSSQPAEPSYFTAGSNKDALHIDISDNKANAISNPHDALQKAEQLFDEQDYQGAQDVLNQANDLLNQTQ